MMLHSRKNIAALSGITVFLLTFYLLRWGLLGLVNIGPPKGACENIRDFNAYLKNGGNPSAYRSRTPFITCAVESSSQEIVSQLLDLEVDIESPKKSGLIYFLTPPFDTGTTPLYAAARDGDLPLVKLLVDRGADPQREGRGWSDSPFNVAVENGHAAVVRYFLETKGREIDLNQYVIEKSAREGHIETLSALVESGLWTNDKGEYSQALAFAAQGEYLETMKFLLSVGANIDGGVEAVPPLYWMAVKENFEIAEYLIENGANVNMVHPRKAETPVSASSEFGHHEFLLFLVDHGADVHVSDDWGNTPLHYAISPAFDRRISPSDRHKVVQILLENDVDINKKNNEGKTALDLAIQTEQSKIIDWLTELGADRSL